MSTPDLTPGAPTQLSASSAEGKIRGDQHRTEQLSLWVPVSFAVTGLLIGFVAGQSSSPVVGTLLPLLFGVIGGGVGFFSVKQTEGSQTIGISLTLLSALCLAGVIHGIHLRSQTPLRCFWATCVEPPPVPAVLDLPPATKTHFLSAHPAAAKAIWHKPSGRPPSNKAIVCSTARPIPCSRNSLKPRSTVRANSTSSLWLLYPC
jgi:hypothetical protein